MIRVLTKETIDKIAAGEVIERPESVVKELLDNAIDSGAGSISIELSDGGLALIRVTDNGCGIQKEEIPIAFLRHATSKLQNADDLQRIQTMGFRGEALASICGVSEVELITKRREDLFGVQYRIAGGKEEGLSEIGAPDGTTVLVRNLFYNVPVRKSFLKTAKTESGYVADIVEKAALAYPEIAFNLKIDGRLLLHTAGNGKLADVIYTLYGKAVSSELIVIDEALNGIRIHGMIARPVVARAKRAFEIYFVNKRFVRSAVIEQAIEAAYEPFMMQHKFPFVVLNLEIDPAFVDVNVHPKKMEVRFSDNASLQDAVEAAISAALHKEELIIDAAKTQTSETGRPPRAFYGDAAALAKDITSSRDTAKFKEPEKIVPKNVLQPETETQKAEEPIKLGELIMAGEPAKAEKTAELPPAYGIPPAAHGLEAFEAKREQALGRHAARDGVQDAARDSAREARDSVLREQPADGGYGAKRTEKPEQLTLPRFLSEEAAPSFHMIGQVFKTYWIIEYNDCMYLIDQHAAHEKVNYERFMRLIADRRVEAQMLLPPILLSLSVKEASLVTEHLQAFSELGFEIEPGEGRDFLVRALPANLPGLADASLLLELIDSLDEVRGLRAPERVREKLASMSCKAAVKGNRNLSRPEMEALIGALLQLENPYACPHGRPTIAKWTKYELDKIFKRIV